MASSPRRGRAYNHPMLRLLAAGLGLSALLAAAEPPAAPAAAPTAPPSGQVRGTITYGRHAPAVGAIVIVRPENAPSPVRAATTGDKGTFAFDGLADGTYRAEVRRDGFAPVMKLGIPVRAPFRAVVEVVLVPGESPRDEPKAVSGTASLAGTIRIAGAAPLAEARVRLTRPDGADDSRSLLTDAAGAFSLAGLKAGRWHLEVVGAGLLPLRADLDLVGDVAIEAALATQPANYRPLPRDLIVPEEIIPPYFGAPEPSPPRTAK